MTDVVSSVGGYSGTGHEIIPETLVDPHIIARLFRSLIL